MTEPLPRILLVEDSPEDALLIRSLLELEDSHQLEQIEQVERVETLAEAITILGKQVFDVVLLDLTLPDSRGIDTVLRLEKAAPTCPVVVLTAVEDDELALEALRCGAQDYLSKRQLEPSLLGRSIRYAIERHRLNLALERALHELEEANARLEQLARLDGLTGIANRREFHEAIDREWRRAAREKQPIALVLVDIDFFKRLNDSSGHLAGDECLRRFANLLLESIHRPTDLAARFGGEEFVLMLPGDDRQGAQVIAERFRDRLAAAQLEHPDSPIGPWVTASFGIAARTPDPDTSPTILIDAADQALYRAKEAGRDQIFAA